MSDANSSAAAPDPPRLVIERTYRASVDELWELWTTKEGFESWWPPEGLRTKVHVIESRPNGKVHYDMIAEAPEALATLKKLGLPASHLERARFSEFRPRERLVLKIMMDFIPGVEPYENTITVDFMRSGEWVRMVVTLCPMHSMEFTKLAFATLQRQIEGMGKRFESRDPSSPV
jgi:uncharacterized protein YndB with AHSA1/START domain